MGFQWSAKALIQKSDVNNYRQQVSREETPYKRKEWNQTPYTARFE